MKKIVFYFLITVLLLFIFSTPFTSSAGFGDYEDDIDYGGYSEGYGENATDQLSEEELADSGILYYDGEFGTEGSCGKNVRWYLDKNGLLSIKGTGNMKFTQDRSPFSFNDSISAVKIYSGVTSIETKAFAYCRNLRNISIADSVTSIGDKVFYNCESLKTITVDSGNSVYHSDENCLIETGSNMLKYGCANSEIPSDGTVTSIGKDAFNKCTGLTRITIPNCVTRIGERSFMNCTGLTSLILPDSITIIEESAFQNCSRLLSISLSNNIMELGNFAFQNCSGLTSLIIPNSITKFGYNAFDGCSDLISVKFQPGTTVIPEGLFYDCNKLSSVTIPDSIIHIENDVFPKNLEDVYYGGSEQQWNDISINSWHSWLDNAVVHYNSADAQQEDAEDLSDNTNNKEKNDLTNKTEKERTNTSVILILISIACVLIIALLLTTIILLARKKKDKKTSYSKSQSRQIERLHSFCKNCGANLNSNDTFCPKCGRRTR